MRELFARWAVDNPLYLRERVTEGNRVTEHQKARNDKASEALASGVRPVLVWVTAGNLAPVAQVAQEAEPRVTALPKHESQQTQAPQEVVAQVAQVAPEIGHPLIQLGPARDDADAWQDWIDAVEARWRARGHAPEEARRIAWGYGLNAWWDRHGVAPGPNVCAGCGEPIEPGTGRRLIDGVYVHDRDDEDPFECQLAFGRRWRGDAWGALVAMGLTAPERQDDD